MNYLPNLLIVDDDTSAIRILSKALSSLGQIRFATGGAEALRLARETAPDLVLLDAEMPGMRGFQVCEALKADPALRDVPVIFITSHAEADMEEAGLALGAVDFIGKPIRPAIVSARAKAHLRLKLAMDQLNLLAQTDGLTGLANRRFLDQSIEREWFRAVRNQRPFSLLMLDIDFFKRYNDCYGHVQGDQCLIAVASALQHCIRRPTDLVARYGGEEFAVLLPETDSEGACLVAEQIVSAVGSLALVHRDSDYGRVSLSVGVASFDSNSSLWQVCARRPAEVESAMLPGIAELLACADRALYQAKHEGRNCSRFVRIDRA